MRGKNPDFSAKLKNFLVTYDTNTNKFIRNLVPYLKLVLNDDDEGKRLNSYDLQ